MTAKKLVYQMYPLAWENMHTEVYKEWDNPFNRMCDHLERVKKLGCDYVWLSPFYPSPRYDHGYDISDYMKVDERLGSLADLDYFIGTAHQLGIKVILDLVLNHTSTKHIWFKEHPEYYIWSETIPNNWCNLFDDSPAWSYSQDHDKYYLHLFHQEQADLNWFPDGKINADLAYKFRRIVDYWADVFDVDGFRLDIPQAMNKDLSSQDLELSDLLFGHQATEIINAIFKSRTDLFLMMECIDPTNGELVDYYANNTPVDFVLDVGLKDKVEKSENTFLNSLDQLCRSPHFMLDLESHDSPRFPSRGITAENMIWWMFNSNAKAICLYQGQELGLNNPTKEELPDEIMLALDARTAMMVKHGESIDNLRQTSRANARISLPLRKYQKQEQDPGSYLSLTKAWIRHWKSVEKD